MMNNNWIIITSNKDELIKNIQFLERIRIKFSIKENEQFDWTNDISIIFEKHEKDTNLPSKFISILFNKNSRKLYLILISANRSVLLARNTYISQGYQTFLKFQIELENLLKIKNIPAFLFLDKLENKNIPSSILISIKSFMTIYGKNSILNENIKIKNMNIFNSVEEFIGLKYEVRSTNRGNKSSYIENAYVYDQNTNLNKKYVNAFLKFNGANAGDSFLIYKTLRKLFSGNIYLYLLTELSEKDYLFKNLFKKDQKLIISYSGNIIINKTIVDYKAELDTFKAKRNQAKFHFELFQIFGAKKCLLCETNIPDLIVGSHIKRVTDIIKDENLTEDQKQDEIETGQNGFWLCVLHDKLFENGRIWFDKNQVKISNNQPSNYKEFIEKTLDSNTYNAKFISLKRTKFQEQHKNRIFNIT